MTITSPTCKPMSKSPPILQGPITNQGTTLNTKLCDNDRDNIKLRNHIKQPIMLQGPITNQGTTLNTQLCDNDHDNIKLQNHMKQPIMLQGPIIQPPTINHGIPLPHTYLHYRVWSPNRYQTRSQMSNHKTDSLPWHQGSFHEKMSAARTRGYRNRCWCNSWPQAMPWEKQQQKHK